MSDVSASSRREFVKVAGSAALGASLFNVDALAQPPSKRRYAIVGTGDRGSGMWGRDLVARYPDLLEFVGLCDINPKRTQAAQAYMGVAAPTFTNFEEMIEKTKPELLMVTTVDGFHHEYIVKGLDRSPPTRPSARRSSTPRSATTSGSSSPSTTATRRRTSR
jgi:hypothetical protein